MVIWYGLGVRMCAPSMPPAPEPSTILSRVVPHEACLAMLVSVMPYLSNSFFSLATMSGEAVGQRDEAQRHLFRLGPLGLREGAARKGGAHRAHQGRRRGGAFEHAAPSERRGLVSHSRSPELKSPRCVCR